MRRTLLALAAALALAGCANTYVAGDLGPGRFAAPGDTG